MLKLIQAYQRVGLVPLIVIGLILGILGSVEHSKLQPMISKG